MPLRPGENFGPFKIVDSLGRGGMGVVFRAFEPNPGRHVALKVLPTEYLHDESFGERFRREATFIANLEHPNIVPLYEVGIDEGVPWMAMRLVGGGPLSALIRRERVTRERVVEILRGMASALDYAHGRKVIHRDVKPQNVLLDESGHVYLADFGLARILEGASLPQGAMSLTGGTVGTPHYMAPEQAGATTVDQRCDIYALGIVAYEMLAGQVPFTGDTPIQVLMKHASAPVPTPSPSEVSPVFLDPVLRALAKDPDQRWPSAGAFVRALEQGLEADRRLGASLPPMQDMRFEDSYGLTVPPPATPPRLTTSHAPPTQRQATPAPAVRPAAGAIRTSAPTGQTPRLGVRPSREPERSVKSSHLASVTRGAKVVIAGALVVAGLALGFGTWIVFRTQTRQAEGANAGPPVSPVRASPKALPAQQTGEAGSLPAGTTRVAPTLAAATPGPTRSAVLAPAASGGFLQVIVVPWADVTVDGAAVTTGPLRRVPLAAGPHVVRVTHPDYEPVQRHVTIKAGETLSLSLDLPEEGVRKVR